MRWSRRCQWVRIPESSSNTKGTGESVDKKGMSIQGLWIPMKQNKAFMCKDEEACNLWSRTLVYYLGADHIRLATDSTLQYHKEQVCCLNWVCFLWLAVCVWLQCKYWELQSDSRSASDNTVRQFWVYGITSICFLELLPQLGSLAVWWVDRALSCKWYKHEKISREGWDRVWAAHWYGPYCTRVLHRWIVVWHNYITALTPTVTGFGIMG